MSEPTRKDAELLIKLYSTMVAADMWEAFNWAMGLDELSYEEFAERYPLGSDGYNHFMKIGSYYELIGILVKYGTINEDMVLDYYYTLWDKLGPLVKGYQEAMGSPGWFENYEYLGKKKAEWRKSHPPGYKMS